MHGYKKTLELGWWGCTTLCFWKYEASFIIETRRSVSLTMVVCCFFYILHPSTWDSLDTYGTVFYLSSPFSGSV